jgi:hypothetical protein
VRKILPDLLVGPGIAPADVARLRRAGVTAVLSLQEPGADILDGAMARIRAACARPPEILWRNVAIRDYDPEDLIRRLPDALTALRELIGGGRVVYLHCCEGVNRAPSVALAHLVFERRLELDEALETLLAAHAQARPYEQFLAWIRDPKRR